MKKLLSVLLSIILIISICPSGVFTFTASAATYSGSCGKNLTWEYDDSTYTLTIYGTGAMSGYSYSYYNSNYVTTAPWKSYYNAMKTLVIGSGVTSIGSYAFYGCTGLTSITIPDSVTSIGYRAFSGCSGLKRVNYTGDIAGWCNIAFSGSDSNPLYYAHNLYIADQPVTNLVIPDGVTSIGNYAFYGCTGLTSITIPDSVTSIGYDAFYGCSGLKTAGPIGGGYDYEFGWTDIIPNNAFRNCTGLTSITIPDSVTSIGYSAFEFCTGLTSITIPDSVTSIGDDAFYNCTGLTSITIPDSVTSIGSYAFDGCSGLTSITIPDSVTSIGDGAFSGCTGLTSITIPDSVTSIGNKAFSGCSGLESLSVDSNNTVYHSAGNCLIKTHSKTLIAGCKNSIIPADGSVTSIGKYAFYGCGGPTSITIPDSVTSIGSYAFYGCSGLTSITIPNSVTYINERAFYGCSGLTSITIPDSVTYIGEGAFSGCSGLASLSVDSNNTVYHSAGNCLIKTHSKTLIAGCKNSVIPADGSVTSIDNYAFSGCTGLTSITIPDSVTSIGEDAFRGCTGLTSITIPDSVTSIGSSAFYGCTGLTSITIPDSVTSIGSGAFRGCSGLKTAGPIGGGYDYEFGWTDIIPNYAFRDCTGLTSITIPDSVTSIGDYVFYNCTGLTSITIPDSVTSIGEDAFRGCTGLTSITIPDSVTSIGSSAFYGCTIKSIIISEGSKTVTSTMVVCKGTLESVTIPDSVTSIGSYAFDGCTGLTSITIPDSVTSIGEDAFRGCTGLTSITIPDSVTSIGNGAFDGCSSLTEITLPFVGDKRHKSTDTYQYPFGYIFGTWSYTGGKETEQYYYGSSNSSTTSSTFCIPASLKKVTITDCDIVQYGAFYNCTGLTSITIPGSVTSIGEGAFYGCSGLKTAGPIGGGYDYEFGWTDIIPNNAFDGCSGLTSITIPDSVTSIGDDAFWGCTGLKDVYYAGTEQKKAGISIGSYNSSILNAAWHYYSTGNAKNATCTEPGYTGDTGWLEDGIIVSHGEEIPALGHDYELLVTPPTCTEQGYTTHICSRCGDSYVDNYTEPTSHTLGEWLKDVENHWHICAECGVKLDEAAHTASGWIVDLEPTTRMTGEKHKECTVCGAVLETEIIPDIHIHGDINDDGAVNNKDLTRLFKYLSGYNVDVNEAALDINGDNGVDNKDIIRLYQCLSGWDVEIY